MKKENFIATLSLFTSATTLVCCALPALFVTLGAGAALAGLVSNAGWLVFFTEHKNWVFSFAGTMLTLAGYMQWKNRYAACPVDPVLAKQCLRLRVISKVIFLLSVFIYLIGFTFAYLAAFFI